MISNEDYVKKILQQVLDSYRIIHNLSDKRGDLDVIKKELLKINGFFSVILKKFSESNFQLRSLLDLQPKIKNFVQSYYFVQEIDTLIPLYSEDSSRIKNMRLKILEAFQDKKLIDKLQEVLEEL
jgi:hypothetical protein